MEVAHSKIRFKNYTKFGTYFVLAFVVSSGASNPIAIKFPQISTKTFNLTPGEVVGIYGLYVIKNKQVTFDGYWHRNG